HSSFLGRGKVRISKTLISRFAIRDSMSSVVTNASFNFSNGLIHQSESPDPMSSLVGSGVAQLALCIAQRVESRLHVRLVVHYLPGWRLTPLRLAPGKAGQDNGKQGCRQDFCQY